MSEVGAETSPKGRSLRLRVASVWQRCLEQEVLWLVLFLLAGMWVLLPQGPLFVSAVEVGDIASRAWVASRELLKEDVETTDEKRARAREEVQTVYDFEPGAARAREEEVVQLFEVGRATLLSTDDGPAEDQESVSALEALLQASQVRITPEQLDLLTELGFPQELEERIRALLGQLLRRGVVSNKAELLEDRERGIMLRNLETGIGREQLDLYRYLAYPDEVRELIVAESQRWRDLERSQRAQIQAFLLANASPNIHLNRSETLARRQAEAEATAPVFQRARAGQVIVRRGDEIDATAAHFINEMIGGRSRMSLVLPMAGQLLLLVLGALTVRISVRRDGAAPGITPRRSYSGILMVLILSLLCLRLCFLVTTALSGFFESPPFNSQASYHYAVPYASVALVVLLLYNRSVALVCGLVFSVISGQIAGAEAASTVVIYSLGGSLAAVYFLDQVKKRASVNSAGLVVGIVNVVSVVMITTLGADGRVDLELLGFSVACGLVGGLLVAAVAGFSVPLFEWLLSLTTDVTLVELSNTNLPALRRLAFEAPGTFQHSLMVANLAKAGCAEIGADAVLAYTAGLYHDIGKLHRPEYFIENQRGQNPHDHLDPLLSAQIVIEHVTEGERIAREARLPEIIVDAILQHHGTNRLGFFYNRAKEASGGADVPDEPYRYPGPRPQSRTMGVLMLADAVEAASRSLSEPTPASLRNVVDQIFEAHVRAGQLDETDLTLSDLKRLADELQRVLETLHHRRVDYPGFDFREEEQKRGERFRVVGGA
jgi:putative nucleotidyltransferase with HDIG domain